MAGADQFAQVITDVAGLPPLDYIVPEDELVAVGDRVIVPVGAQKTAGIVVSMKEWPGIEKKRLRSLSRLLDGIPPLSAEWLAFTRFAAGYYCRSWGEVALPAIPAFFRRKPGVRHENSLAKLRELPQPAEPAEPQPPLSLNADQQAAVDRITEAGGFSPWLLFGVTGSGKTEVYLQAMARVLERDPQAQVLMLVPEINLTPQLEARVRSHFPGEAVVTMNSDLAPSARARSWLAVHEGRARILVGTRMAVFASFRHLALIIVDEEHDLSYKSGDGSRYSARDLSVKRAHDLGIPVILGSATPSLESWALARRGKYRMLELRHRAVASASVPSLELIAPSADRNEHIAPRAGEAISEALERGEQALVFLNRRGYSPVLACPSCGWVSQCPNCSTGMVFHKDIHRLVCHHCGLSRPVPERCPDCGAADILPVGAGTQRIEEEIARKWPEAKLLRIDRDNFKTKRATEKAFRDVHEGKVDILLGTQMIAKGHDFRNVSLVVALNSDAQLVSTDVRAKERLFATLLQVSGRAGRAGRESRMVLETRYPNDPLFGYLERQDFRGYADAQLEERRDAGAPPFVFQAMFTADHEDLEQAMACLRQVLEAGLSLLDRRFPEAVISIYDPVPMAVVKVANRNRAQLLIESPSRKQLHEFLRALELPKFPGGNITLEIDPLRF